MIWSFNNYVFCIFKNIFMTILYIPFYYNFKIVINREKNLKLKRKLAKNVFQNITIFGAKQAYLTLKVILTQI